MTLSSSPPTSFSIGSSSTLNLSIINDPNEPQGGTPTQIESFQLHNKIYDNVYILENVVGNASEIDIDYFYSLELGLIGFANSDKSISYKFERAE